MDVFKLAFETMIVGLLACTWLSVAIDLLFPTFFSWLISSIGGKNENLIGLALLSLAYCFGSAIMPIADQLLNDEHWPLPEYAIRCWVSMEENDRLKDISEDTELLPNYKSTEDFEVCRCSYWDIFFKKDQDKNSQKVQKVFDIPPTWEEFKRRKTAWIMISIVKNCLLFSSFTKTRFLARARTRPNSSGNFGSVSSSCVVR